MNPFRDTSAPYLLAALLAAVGWLISHAVDNMDEMLIVEYATRLTDNDYRVRISNKSLRYHLNHEVTVACPNGRSCFSVKLCSNLPTPDPTCVRGVQADLVPVPPWTTYDSEIDRRHSAGAVLLARVNMPPQGSLILVAALSDTFDASSGTPVFYFGNRGLKEIADQRLLIIPEGSIHLKIFSYYYMFLFWSFVVLMALLSIWLLGAFTYTVFRRHSDRFRDLQHQAPAQSLKGHEPVQSDRLLKDVVAVLGAIVLLPLFARIWTMWRNRT